jgi:hypothetical protein
MESRSPVWWPTLLAIQMSTLLLKRLKWHSRVLTLAWLIGFHPESMTRLSVSDIVVCVYRYNNKSFKDHETILQSPPVHKEEQKQPYTRPHSPRENTLEVSPETLYRAVIMNGEVMPMASLPNRCDMAVALGTLRFHNPAKEIFRMDWSTIVPKSGPGNDTLGS